ncbi:peptidase S8 and S53 [Hypoxylon trugodes]|uniref:peptidase S8 and S53 n=1 Tax=Hypoxylon trugodes TaxID=326681 RepID=UPI002193118D|nr:peptidase S8 and S53 [Hypoxylon trugodes]KAI1385695.1 peptidase S8 and S53 [Hypoxylon trugodes]
MSSFQELGTQLLQASQNGNVTRITELLRRGANPDFQDEEGNTALHVAANFAVVEALTRGVQARTLTIYNDTVNFRREQDLDIESKYILVQCLRRLDAGQKERLSALGLDFREYIAKNTYLCYNKKDVGIPKILDFPFVSHVDEYSTECKLPRGSRYAEAENLYEVSIRLHNNISVDEAEFKTPQKQIREAAELGPEDLILLLGGKVRLAVRGKFLERLVSIDEVRRIEQVGKRVPAARRALEILGVSVPHGLDVTERGAYRGAGQLIAVADTGVDTTHPAFTGRIREVVSLGPDQIEDKSGHGTHVCALAVGNHLGGDRPMGSASQAELLVQCMGNESEYGHLENMLPDAYNLGARVHSNSWGTTVENNQTDQGTFNAEVIDKFVRKNPDMVICFSIGNNSATGNVPLLLSDEAYEKNCITIGASESSRLSNGDRIMYENTNIPLIRSRRDNTSLYRVATFSNHGYRNTCRIKPDLVAPGTDILSARSQFSQPPSAERDRDLYWCYMNGTSMATPLVAGCAAAVREALIANRTGRPSAALIKALLINGADWRRQREANVESGFGRVNVTKSLQIACGMIETGFWESGLRDGRDGAFLRTVRVGPGTLKVTLVWMDPEGPMIRNVLLLKVRNSDGETRRGYHRYWDREGEGFVNNVQQIVWDLRESQDVIIRVAMYGVNDEPSGRQYFAVVYRCDSSAAMPHET